mmetsp:Transcript_18620/g.56215  ORF Transcript_18620/g.56215 Transcript_18620/m.56215 type:complete len:359 (-) Transcript_18620:872-1948(-)
MFPDCLVVSQFTMWRRPPPAITALQSLRHVLSAAVAAIQLAGSGGGGDGSFLLGFVQLQPGQVIQQLLQGHLGEVAVIVVGGGHGGGRAGRTTRRRLLVLEQGYPAAHVRILLQFLEEVFHVGGISVGSLAGSLRRCLLCARSRLHRQPIQLPGPRLPLRVFPRPLLLVALLHQNDLRGGAAALDPAVQVRVHRVGVLEVVPQRRVARVQDLAQVSDGCVHPVVAPEVRLPRHLGLSEGVAGGGGPQQLNVQHHKLHQLLGQDQRPEGGVPVCARLDLGVAQGERVHQREGRGHAAAQHQWPQVAQTGRQLCRQAHQVVLADGHNLDRKGVLVVVVTGMNVVADQLLGGAELDGDHCL